MNSLSSRERERKELEERELAAQKLARLEKAIQDKRHVMASDLLQSEKYNKFIEAGYEKLNRLHPDLYTLTYSKKSKEYKITEYIRPEGEGSDTPYKQITVWSETSSYEKAILRRKDAKNEWQQIIAEEHTVYTGNRRARAVSRGLKFKLEFYGDESSRRFYTNIETCHKKIQEIVDLEEARNRKANAVEYTLKKVEELLQQQYPAGNVRVLKQMTFEGYHEIQVTIRFQNGFGVKAAVYPNMNNLDAPTYGTFSLLAPSSVWGEDPFSFVNGVQNLPDIRKRL